VRVQYLHPLIVWSSRGGSAVQTRLESGEYPAEQAMLIARAAAALAITPASVAKELIRHAISSPAVSSGLWRCRKTIRHRHGAVRRGLAPGYGAALPLQADGRKAAWRADPHRLRTGRAPR
jgi:hypothetical protein